MQESLEPNFYDCVLYRTLRSELAHVEHNYVIARKMFQQGSNHKPYLEDKTLKDYLTVLEETKENIISAMIKRGEKALGAANVKDKSKNEIIEEMNKKEA